MAQETQGHHLWETGAGFAAHELFFFFADSSVRVLSSVSTSSFEKSLTEILGVLFEMMREQVEMFIADETKRVHWPDPQ